MRKKAVGVGGEKVVDKMCGGVVGKAQGVVAESSGAEELVLLFGGPSGRGQGEHAIAQMCRAKGVGGGVLHGPSRRSGRR